MHVYNRKPTWRERMAKHKPGLKIESVFGQSKITVSDEQHRVSLWLTKAGVEALIEELQAVLDTADDDSGETNAE